MEDMMDEVSRVDSQYEAILGNVAKIVDTSRSFAARSVNAAMTASYWMIGRSIVEFEQSGEDRAEYGARLLEKLSADLTQQYGRGFSRQNIQFMRAFYLAYPINRIRQTLFGEFTQSILPAIRQTPSGESDQFLLPTIMQTPSTELDVATTESHLRELTAVFPLPWSAYVRLLSVKNVNAREFYETEALRGGWSVRQLDRQINSQFYERTALSKNKATMLARGQNALPGDAIMPEEAIKDPFVLEFLDLKDEYSENDLEEALINHLETFLLELGDDFCFMGRQKRLRVGNEWFRVDLLFFHRGLRCLVIVDLKIGKFTHADSGQMNMYLNYARENWVRDGENPPVGLILCSEKDEAVARYSLEGLLNKVMAVEYQTALPDEDRLAAEIQRTRQAIDLRRPL